MADWEEFYDYFAANFKRLTENDGVKEWRKFIEDQVHSMDALRAGLAPYAEKYATGLEKMEPVKAPTLPLVQKVFYAECARRKAENDRRRFGDVANCPLCMGNGWLYVVMGKVYEDESLTGPPNFRTFDYENFGGIAMAKCTCSAKYSLDMKTAIERNGLPYQVTAVHPDFPTWYADEMQRRFPNLPRIVSVAGDQVLTLTMNRTMMQRRRNAG